MAMKPCKECGKEVSTSAKTCPNCGTPNPIKKTSSAGVGCLVILVVFTVLYAIGSENGQTGTSSTSTSVPTDAAEPSAPASPQLELLSFSWSREHGFIRMEGQVKNISNQPLENVTAVSSYDDDSGTFIKSGDALIDYNPILPGQTSPFSTITSDNPAIARGGVEFKKLMGGTISTKRND